MKKDYKAILRICSKIMFGVYIICLAYFLFFAESTGRTFEGRTYHYNLELFKEIRRFIAHRHTLGAKAVMLNLVGNIVAFLPFGFFLPILYPRCRSFLRTVFFSFECSLIVETIQLVSKVGSFDVDDMLLNTIGGALGCLIFHWMNRIRREYETKEKKIVLNLPGKNIPKRGKLSLSLAVCSCIAAVGMVVFSIQSGGQANVYIGCAGLFTLLLSAVSFLIGLTSLREESYKLFPVLGSVCSGLILAGWAAIYALGFYV